MKWSGIIIIVVVVSHFPCVILFIVCLLGKGSCFMSWFNNTLLVSSLLCLHGRNLSIQTFAVTQIIDNGDDEQLVVLVTTVE